MHVTTIQQCGKTCVQWRGCEKPVCSDVEKLVCSDVAKSFCAVMWLWKTCVQWCAGKACVQWCGCDKPVCSDVVVINRCAVMWLWKTSVQWCGCEKPVCGDVEKLVCNDVVVKNLCAVIWKSLCAVMWLWKTGVQWCGKACVQWCGYEKPVCSDVEKLVYSDVVVKNRCAVMWKSLCAVTDVVVKNHMQWCGCENTRVRGCIVEKPVCSDVLWKNLCREWRIVETPAWSDVWWKNRWPVTYRAKTCVPQSDVWFPLLQRHTCQGVNRRSPTDGTKPIREEN